MDCMEVVNHISLILSFFGTPWAVWVITPPAKGFQGINPLQPHDPWQFSWSHHMEELNISLWSLGSVISSVEIFLPMSMHPEPHRCLIQGGLQNPPFPKMFDTDHMKPPSKNQYLMLRCRPRLPVNFDFPTYRSTEVHTRGTSAKHMDKYMSYFLQLIEGFPLGSSCPVNSRSPTSETVLGGLS